MLFSIFHPNKHYLYSLRHCWKSVRFGQSALALVVSFMCLSEKPSPESLVIKSYFMGGPTNIAMDGKGNSSEEFAIELCSTTRSAKYFSTP